MLTPCQKCLRSFLTLPSAFILSVFVDYTEFSEVSCLVRGREIHLSFAFRLLHRAKYILKCFEWHLNQCSIFIVHKHCAANTHGLDIIHKCRASLANKLQGKIGPITIQYTASPSAVKRPFMTTQKFIFCLFA